VEKYLILILELHGSSNCAIKINEERKMKIIVP
jgi:hypothetical protein